MMRRRVGASLFVVAALALCCSARAGSQSVSENARMLLDYQSFMRGDRDGAVRFALTASKDMQGTPLAELAVRLALYYDPATLSSVDVGETEARRVLGNGTDLTPEFRDILRRFIARSAAASGRRDEAMEIHRRRGLAMSWLVAGPFTGRKTAVFSSREMPRPGPVADGDIIDHPPDAARFREWIKRPPLRPLPDNRSFPFVRPWRLTGRDVDGAMFMLTGLEAGAADNKAEFHVYAETSWRLFIDGALVAEVDKNNAEAPAEHAVPFSLNPGAHTVALQVFPPRAGISRFDARVALRLESSVSFTWDRKAAVPDLQEKPSARRDARRLKYLTDLEAAKGESFMATAAYSVACMEQRMYDEASWWAESAARNNPDDVDLQFLAGVLVAANPLLPPERRRDMAVAWHQGALRVKPDIVPSLLYLAGVASEAGLPREAAEYLERAYQANSGSLDVLMARGDWANRFASGATARAAWDECGKAFPNSSAVQLAIATLPQGGFLDMDRRLAACRAAVAAGPYLPETSLKLAEALADSGNQQEAEYVLRDAISLFAGDVKVLIGISEVYSRLSLHREAIENISEAVRINPDDADLWRRMGDYHMEAHDQEKAVAMWKVSLAANPGQFQLADMIDSLEGRDAGFFSTGGYDAIAMTADAEPDRYPGDVVRLLDRSIIRIEADGSFRRLTHEIDLAKNRQGGESLASIGNRGELLSARIVFPNGNTLEPEPYPGYGGLRLPVIMPGAAREVRYLESVPAARNRPPAITPWFFQDPEGRLPFLISEYIVQAPRNFPLICVVRNLGNNVDYEKTVEGDFDVYRWTATLSLPSDEPDAVHMSERVPSVEIGIKTGWDDIVFDELRSLEGRLTPSKRMLEVVGPHSSQSTGEQKARELYRYVLDNIEPSPDGAMASHVQVDRMGNRWLLLLALLQAAELDAQPAAARPGTRFLSPPNWDLPSRDIFTVPMIRLSIPGGDTYWLDVRYDSLPFGAVADDLSGATVLTFAPDGPLFDTLPSLPAEDSLQIEERQIALPEPDGVLSADVRTTMRGVAGLVRGKALAEANQEERKKMALRHLFPVFPDAALERFEVLRVDEIEAASHERSVITSRIPVEKRPEGHSAVSLCLAPLGVISEETRNLTERRTACHIATVHIAEDRNVFTLPPGGKFVRLPEPAQIPSRFGLYQLRVVRAGENRVTVIRNYHIPAQRISPWEWRNFLDFLERIDLAEMQWIEYSCPSGE